MDTYEKFFSKVTISTLCSFYGVSLDNGYTTVSYSSTKSQKKLISPISRLIEYVTCGTRFSSGYLTSSFL